MKQNTRRFSNFINSNPNNKKSERKTYNVFVNSTKSNSIEMDKLSALIALLRNKIPVHMESMAKVKSGFCNWVIPGRLMCGPYPGFDGCNFETHEAAIDNINNIIDDGVNVFICLQQEEQHHQGKPLYASIAGNDIVYKHFPIEDHQIPSHKDFLNHLYIILELLASGKNIYIHCLGGHGRTGTYIAGILMLLFSFNAKQALYYTQYFHNSRRILDKRSSGPIPCMSPENDCQIEFIKHFEIFLKFLL